MPLTITITRGYTFTDGVPYSTDDLNAAALPNIAIAGTVGAAELEDGGVTVAKVKPGAYFYATATGGPVAYLATISPAPDALGAGLTCRIRFTTTNTTAAPTLALNGLAATEIRKLDRQALTPGDLSANAIHELVYDGTYWLMQTEAGTPRRFWPTSTGTGTAYAVTFPGLNIADVADVLGLPLVWKAHTSSTGAATLAINGEAAVTLARHDGTAIQAGDIALDAPVVALFDGSKFRCLNVVNVGTPPSAAVQAVVNSANGTATALGTGTTVASTTATLPAGKTWKLVRVTFSTWMDDQSGIENFVLQNGGSPVTTANTSRGSYITNNSDDAQQVTVTWEWVPSGGAESANLTLDVLADKPGGSTNGDNAGSRKVVVSALAQ
jgi:hypothetical protein